MYEFVKKLVHLKMGKPIFFVHIVYQRYIDILTDPDKM